MSLGFFYLCMRLLIIAWWYSSTNGNSFGVHSASELAVFYRSARRILLEHCIILFSTLKAHFVEDKESSSWIVSEVILDRVAKAVFKLELTA